MTRGEPRGAPGRYEPKHQPRLKLADLIRRRKTTLKQMVLDRGITAYASLVHWCERIGVVPPTEDEFKAVFPEPVNSPQEGVVVLQPPPVIEEQTGRQIDPEAPIELPGVQVLTDHPFEPPESPFQPPTTDSVRPPKKLKKKDKDQPPEQE
jgi:hypothetical protein